MSAFQNVARKGKKARNRTTREEKRRQKEIEVKDPLLLPIAKRRDTQVEKRGRKENGSHSEEGGRSGRMVAAKKKRRSKPSLTPD